MTVASIRDLGSTRLTSDVVVVGSGSGGAVIACLLAEAGHEVSQMNLAHLLDTGGTVLTFECNILYYTFNHFFPNCYHSLFINFLPFIFFIFIKNIIF